MKGPSIKQLALSCLAFGVILVRDFSVYPGYTWGQAILTSFIRLMVLVITLVLTHVLYVCGWKRKGSAVPLFLLWLCILPHSFYNITQVRHLSEICRLPQGGFFAGQCNGLLWSILPLLIYGVGSLFIFFSSVDKVASTIRNSCRTIFTVSLFAYASLGLVAGMYSRIDSVISIFLDPKANISLLASTMRMGDFWVNAFAYFLFANAAYFVGRQLLAHKRTPVLKIDQTETS